MQMQQTKAAKRERIVRLENRLADLRNGFYMGTTDRDVARMIAWFTKVYWKLPEHERQEIKQAWDAYYPASRVDESTPKPQGYDPLLWDHSDVCQQYRYCERELKFLGSDEDTMPEAANVW